MSKIISVLVLALLLLPMVAFAQDTCHLVADLDYVHDDCTQTTDIDGVWTDTDGDGVRELNEPGYLEEGEMPVDQYGQCCLFNSIHVVTNWLSGIIGALVGLFIIVGAFYIVTAGGNPDRVTQGRNYILYAVAGMIVFLFARAIPSIARAIMGM